MSSSTPVISNATPHTMEIHVGNHRYWCNLATVAAGKKFNERPIQVSYNDTYQEYVVEIHSPGLAKVAVSSDDLCDYESLTIKLKMKSDPSDSPGATSKKYKWIPAWMGKIAAVGCIQGVTGFVLDGCIS